MANPHDSEIAAHLISLDSRRQLPLGVLEKLSMVRDDATYWQLLATAWIKWGGSKELDIWRELFSSKRHGRYKLMKKADRKKWRSLPKTVTAYRAIEKGEEIKKAISWTLDPRVLHRIYKDTRTIATAHFNKRSIVAYFSRRDEEELIVL